MEDRTILFVGESHIHAVQTALKKHWKAPEGVDIAAHRLTKIKNGTLIGTLNYNDLLLICEGLGPQDLVVSMIGGNQHSMISLVQHDQAFDILETASEAIVEESELVPRAAMLALFERGLRNNDARRIKQIAGADGTHQTIHLCAPPPKADAQHILKRFESDFAAKGLAEKGVSPADLRRKIWEIQNEALARILLEDKIELMPPPEGTMSDDGFLLPDYYATDATHANAAYGVKVLEQIIAYAKTHPAIADARA